MIVFFFNDTATTEIYTLSLHDALPIFPSVVKVTETHVVKSSDSVSFRPLTLEEAVKEAEFRDREVFVFRDPRSEEHTSELQSHLNLVCRLLLEKIKHTAPVSTSSALRL